MPHKFERLKQKLPKGMDRRCKLTDADREEILTLYPERSQRQLAEQFGVSKRLIQLIVNPETKRKQIEAYHKRGGWRRYYDKNKRAEAMREHRQYKKKVLEND